MARLICWAITFWLALFHTAWAEPRIALVVGNGAYVAVNGLPNPPNDARLMATTLEKAGFTVTLVADGSMEQMSAAVTKFGSALRDAGPETTGLFYYAGHGVQSFGVNYLVPVDARLSNAADLGLVAIDAQSVLRQMFSAHNRTNIVILDACRNNPFENVRDLGDNGLAEMAAPTGTFLAYATAPRAVALDGADGNSPFTEALAKIITKPGLPIEQAFKEVRVAVLQATNGKQTPWDTSSLTNDFAFTPAVDTGAGDEEALWASVMASRDAVQAMLFLRAYPQSAHDADARTLLAEVMQKEVAAPVTKVAAAAADPAEMAAFEAAQTAGTVAGFQVFVDTYPNSQFADAVKAEIALLGTAPRATSPVIVTQVEGAVDMALAAQIAATPVAFATPLTIGTPGMIGKTIEGLIKTSPLYSPVEGLPKEAWAGQSCAACHQWTESALCDQGKFYVKEAAPAVALTQHPLGGEFKLTLRQWAAEGCK
ncbi:MAG: caspase family protein [Paracoccaceae bacterium]